MSNYWNTLSPIHSLLTKRESHAIGGSVGRIGFKKGGKVKSKKKKWGDDFWKRETDQPRPRPKPFDKKDEVKFKKGGKADGDDRWIQKATASIKRRKTEGKCTPITKKGCTGRAKALAKTFKKMAKKRAA